MTATAKFIASLALSLTTIATAADERLRILPDGEPQWVSFDSCYDDPCTDEPERMIYAGLKLDYDIGEDEERDRIETMIGMYAEISFDQDEERVAWSSRTPDHAGLFNVICAIPENYRYDIRIMTLDAEDPRLSADEQWDELDEYDLEEVVEIGGRSCTAPRSRPSNRNVSPEFEPSFDPEM